MPASWTTRSVLIVRRISFGVRLRGFVSQTQLHVAGNVATSAAQFRTLLTRDVILVPKISVGVLRMENATIPALGRVMENVSSGVLATVKSLRVVWKTTFPVPVAQEKTNKPWEPPSHSRVGTSAVPRLQLLSTHLMETLTCSLETIII